MKRSVAAWVPLLVLTLGLVLGGCAGEDGKDGLNGANGATGPQGPPGDDGAPGAPGTADCVLCHNDNTTVAAAIAQYEHSLHSNDSILWETNRAGSSNCYFCHTSEGFVSNLAGNPQLSANPTPVGCRTCHAPHTNKDFRLRTEAAYTLLNGVTFDKGEGNLCANCHHSRTDIRTVFPAGPPDTTTVLMSSFRFGPHYAPQSDVYRGTGGYEYGETIASSPHYNLVEESCVDCHMFTPKGTTVGGHTWWMANEEEGGENIAACNVEGCHSADPLTSFDRPATQDWDGDGGIEGTQTEFEGLFTQLKDMLVARELIDPETNYAAGTFPRRVPTAEAGAIYNFRCALTERSRGIHNTKYIMNLMKKSIEELSKSA